MEIYSIFIDKLHKNIFTFAFLTVFNWFLTYFLTKIDSIDGIDKPLIIRKIIFNFVFSQFQLIPSVSLAIIYSIDSIILREFISRKSLKFSLKVFF